MNGLQEQFVAEARELIRLATEELIAAEREGFSADKIDSVFRAFHTLKGAAGVVDLPAMTLAMHAAEDLLSAVAAGRVESSPPMINRALACLDQVSEWVDYFEANEAESPRAGEDARAMADALRRLEAPARSAAPPRVELTDTVSALPDWAERLIEVHRRKIAGGDEKQTTQLFALSYEPHAGCFFNGDDPLELMRRLPQALAFQIEPREAWGPLAELDPFACNLRLQAISAATRAQLTTLFRLVPDQVRIVEIPLDAAPTDQAALVRSVLEEQTRLLGTVGGRQDHAGRIGSATRTAANALRHGGQNDWADRIENAGASAVSQSNPALLVSVIEGVLSALVSARLEDVQTPESNAPVRTDRLLRVDESKIDALLDLAGELLVVKNGFSHLAKRIEAENGSREIARMIGGQHDTLDRLVGELYSGILQLRMVPVAQVFRSFPRLVRDMAHRLKKSVTLVTIGETTESDKTIVDLLFEPLMHLVRNAVDHGIETPEQRQAAGKSEIATISLGASRRGDRFVVEVIDDGRGIDPATVRRKAEEKRLLSAAELAALSDEQATDLIFAAGFSTASEVSDISGRGVGMDVVRSSIERIGGHVALSSRLGAGTTVSLDLPMNIAMSHIMVVEAGGQAFGIPMDAVSETVRLSPDQISRIKNNDGFVLHDRVVPICSLAELMKLPPRTPASADARLVVVAESGGRMTAIEVDAIRERMEVVLKPMQGLLSNARGYAGTTLTGDGAVLLVLDLKEIVP
jgi:two-component system, chemotaxis family, sensor kinase CheA